MIGKPQQPEEPDRFCLGCRYALRGLRNAVCPECGRGFDPNDPMTYSPTAKRWSWAMPVDGICAAVFAVPFAWLLLASLEQVRDGLRLQLLISNTSPAAFSALLLLGLVTFYVCRVIRKTDRGASDGVVSVLLASGVAVTWITGSDEIVTLYALATCAAMTLILSRRAYRDTSFMSLALGTHAGVICVAAVLYVFNRTYSGHTDFALEFYDYWTYWFWTVQR